MSKENIVRIYGGLGNQLFQFFFGQFLKKKYSIEIKYDISFYNNQSEFIKIGNDFRELDIIRLFPNIKEYLSNKQNITDKTFNRNFINRLFKKFDRVIIEDRLFKYHIDPQIRYKLFLESDFKQRNYFEGYWQNIDYLNEIGNELNFYLDIKKSELIKDKYLMKIINTKSVSIHIRRGDYLKSKLFQPVQLEFIKKSISYFLDLSSDFHFFIFSDDKDWTRSNIKKLFHNYNMELVDSDSKSEDIILMSLCKNNIICNSTYSWWSSFMNENPDKLILAPANWSTNVSLNRYIRKSLLENFIIIS